MWQKQRFFDFVKRSGGFRHLWLKRIGVCLFGSWGFNPKKNGDFSQELTNIQALNTQRASSKSECCSYFSSLLAL